MKTRKNSKLLILVLTLALLIGSVFAITASAAEAETGDLKGVSINHGDTISVAFVVKATQAEITNGTVAVKYTWEGGEEQTATFKTDLGDGYVRVVTNGVAAYDLGKTLTFTVYTNGVAGDTGTYSVATFLYNMLYRDNIEAGAQRDVYETLIAYGAASQVLFSVDTENLVDDLDYVYSKNANVKFGGKSYVLGSTAVTATYSGTGNVEAWIINGQEIASTATTYDVTVDGVVSVDIKVQCVHADANPKDHNCDYCGANEFGTCADTDNNHKCDYCDATLSECADTDNNHYCNVCNAKLSDCVDAGKDHACDICGGNVGGECADGNKDHNCDYCGDKLSDHADNNNDHDCDYCGAEDVTECVDGNRDHVCDICDLAGAPCADGDGDYRCDACNKFSFNGDMIDGQNGMIIYQGQSNDYETTADTVIYSNQVTGAERPAGYDYGAYYSIATDPKNGSNKVLQVNMPARVEVGGKFMTSHVRFSPTGSGDVLVFDYDMYLSSENTPLVDGLYVYLVDDSVFNYDPREGVAEPDNQAGQGYHKVIIQTMEPEDDGTVYIRMGGNKILAVADEWFSVRIVVNAATKSYSMYYSIDGGETYKTGNSNWENRTTDQVDLSKITSVGFKANTYRNNAGLSYNTYVDNVDLYKNDCFSFTANNKEWNYCSMIDENADHVCDGCEAEIACEDFDKNGDYRCDTCGVFGFATDMQSGENGVTILGALSSLSSGVTTAESTTRYDEINGNSKPAGLNRGAYYSLVTDPTDASNSVLSVNVVMPGQSGGANMANYIKIAPVGDASARYIMLEADFYAVSVDASKNIFHFTAFTAEYDGVPAKDNGDGTFTEGVGASKGFQRVSITTKAKATSSAAVGINIAGATDTGATTLQWVSVKFILDTVANKYYVYFSLDGGATFTAIKEAAAPASSTRLANFADVTHMGIDTDTWQVTNGQAYVDNLKVTRVNTIQFGTVTLG